MELRLLSQSQALEGSIARILEELQKVEYLIVTVIVLDSDLGSVIGGASPRRSWLPRALCRLHPPETTLLQAHTTHSMPMTRPLGSMPLLPRLATSPILRQSHVVRQSIRNSSNASYQPPTPPTPSSPHVCRPST